MGYVQKVCRAGGPREMERLDGAGLQEVPKEARSLTSRAACCQSAIRRVESPLCCSHARQGLTSRHGFAISAIVSGRLPRTRLLASAVLGSTFRFARYPTPIPPGSRKWLYRTISCDHRNIVGSCSMRKLGRYRNQEITEY
jgi:hypothetical protein